METRLSRLGQRARSAWQSARRGWRTSQNTLKGLQPLAEVIIAAAAAIGIWLAIDQARQNERAQKATEQAQQETGKALQIAAEAFKVSAYPLIKYEDIQWTPTKSESVSCTKPPTQMFVNVRNVSGVPIEIVRREFQLFINDKPVLTMKPLQTIGWDNEETILPVGQVEAAWAGSSPSMPGFFQSLHGPGQETPPRFVLEVTYRSLVASNRSFVYKAEGIMLMDCSVPGDQRIALRDTNREVETVKAAPRK